MNMRTRIGKASIVALLGLGALGVASYAVYRYLTNRPGEAAIRFIPQDADWVVTLDLKPSERQLSTFQRVASTLEAQGFDKKADDWLKAMFTDEPWANEIRSELDRSFAVAYWSPQKDKPGSDRMMALLSVKNSATVAQELAKSKKVGPDGTLKIDETMVAFVFENYLVVSTDKDAKTKLEATRHGSSPSIAALTEYQEARKALPDDANLMVFASPNALKQMMDVAKSTAGFNPSMGAKWMSFGATVTPDGLQLDCQSPLDPSQLGAMKAAASSKPVDLRSATLLPSGALGFWAISQPGLSIDGMESSLVDGSDEVEEAFESFQEETGLSLKDDVAPGLMGEVIAAVYAADPASGRPVEIMVSFSTKNNANPKALAEKLRAMVLRKSKESGRPMNLRSEDSEGATIWIFDKVDDKEFPIEPCYAETETGVVVATSVEFLKSSLTQAKSGKSLADDPSFANASFLEGTQSMFSIDVRRSLEAFRRQIEPSLSKDQMTWDDILGLTSGATLSGSYRFDGQVFAARGLIPVDFEGVAKMIAKNEFGDDLRTLD